MLILPEEAEKPSIPTSTSQDGGKKIELMRHTTQGYNPIGKLNHTIAAIIPDTVFSSPFIGTCDWQENAHIGKCFSSDFG